MVTYDKIMCRYELKCDRCGAITKTKIMVINKNVDLLLSKYGYERMSPKNNKIICACCLDEISD